MKLSPGIMGEKTELEIVGRLSGRFKDPPERAGNGFKWHG